MSRERDRRAAILESLRAGKTPSEIIAWFGYKKTQVYEITKAFREAEDKDTVTSDRASHWKRSDRKRTLPFLEDLTEKINSNLGQSMNDLAKKSNVSKSTISRAVSKDLRMTSYVLRQRQLLTP